MQSNDVIKETSQYIIFTLDNEYYAVEVLKIREVIGYKPITRIPNSPPFVKGIIDLRGEAVPIIDIRSRFNLPEKEYDKFTVILILSIKNKLIGIIVDSVSDIINFSKEDIQPTPSLITNSNIDREYIAGVIKKENYFVLIVNIDKILFQEELDLL